MFEKSSEKLIARPKFVLRMLKGMGLVAIIAGISLIIGIIGYRLTENMPWLDALLNASMILGGMGPVGDLKTNSGKLFASFYALYSGLFLIGMTGILLTPIIHRVIHSFHETKLKR